MKPTLALLLAVLLLSGCTIGGAPTTAPAATTDAPTQSAASSAPSSATPSTATPTTQAVLASRAGQAGQRKVTISVHRLLVRGETTTLEFSVTNDDSEGALLSSAFSDGVDATVPGSDAKVPDDSLTVDGVYLIDNVNKLRYLPARDSRGVCVCTTLERFQQLQPGNTFPLSAVFTAVPADVTTVDVYVPKAGIFTGIAVER